MASWGTFLYIAILLGLVAFFFAWGVREAQRVRREGIEEMRAWPLLVTGFALLLWLFWAGFTFVGLSWMSLGIWLGAVAGAIIILNVAAWLIKQNLPKNSQIGKGPESKA